MGKFEPKHSVRCKKCGDVIFSKRSGQFVSCACHSCFIDETEHYCRYGGNPEDMIIESLEVEDV